MKKPLDVISTVFNYIIAFTAVPFLAIVAWLGDALGDNESFFNQALYYIPALIILGIAASVALRRKGYKVAGFIAQFVGPVLFILTLVISEILWRVL